MKLYEIVQTNINLDKISEVIARTKNIDEMDEEGMTALMYAVKLNNSSVVELLIEEGIDVNVKNNYGVNALKLARENGDKKILSLLLKAGAVLPSEGRV